MLLVISKLQNDAVYALIAFRVRLVYSGFPNCIPRICGTLGGSIPVVSMDEMRTQLGLDVRLRAADELLQL